MEKAIPVVVALNMWDDTKYRGIDINFERDLSGLGPRLASVEYPPRCTL